MRRVLAVASVPIICSILISVFVGVVLGLQLVSVGIMALAASGFVLVVRIGISNPDALAVMLIVSVFCSRFYVDLQGFRLRPEMFLAAASIVSLCILGRGRLDRSSLLYLLLLSSWVVWLGVVSYFNSVYFVSSLSIVLWLFLDVGAVTFIVAHTRSLDRLVVVGLSLAFISALVGIGLWGLATWGGVRFLVQSDPTYGGYAAYGTVFEANILAALVVLWAAVAAFPRLSCGSPMWLRVSLICASPFIAFATHTRTALVASAIVLILGAVRYASVRVAIVGALPFVFAAWLIGIINLSSVGLGKFTDIVDLSGGTGLYRSLSWRQAFSDIGNDDLFGLIYGLGANTFGQRHLDPSFPGLRVQWYLGNLPLQIVYDGGVIGMTIVMTVLCLLLVGRRSLSAAVFVVVYLIMGIGTSTLWLLQSWIFLALALVYYRDLGGEVDRDRSRVFADRGDGYR